MSEFYIHAKVNDGNVTLCVDGDHVGVAFCAPTDHFCKRVGRAIAKSRLDDPARGFQLSPANAAKPRGAELRTAVVGVFLLWLYWLDMHPAHEDMLPRWLHAPYFIRARHLP